MKKFVLTMLVIMVTISLSGQNINNIIKKHVEAGGGDIKKEQKSMVVEGSGSQMNMTMDLKILEKKPDKLKMVTKFNGVELIQVVNGNSGFMVNPLTGSNEPIELSISDIGHLKDNSLLTNSLERLLLIGKIELSGSTIIEGEEVFELKSTSETGDTFYYISKKSYYLVAIKTAVSQMGQDLNVEMRMSEFTNTEGVLLPMKMDTYLNGTLTVTMIYKTIKFNVDIPDSEFEKK